MFKTCGKKSQEAPPTVRNTEYDNTPTNYIPHSPITGKLVGECHSCWNPAIVDFELCLVTSKLQEVHSDREIVLRDIPRGGVFGSSYFPIFYHPLASSPALPRSSPKVKLQRRQKEDDKVNPYFSFSPQTFY